jgi:short-subunit dehydrogenase
MQDTRMMRMLPVMNATEVAAIAYRGYRAGKSTVVTGAFNRVMAASSRLAPTGLLTAMTRRMNG